MSIDFVHGIIASVCNFVILNKVKKWLRKINKTVLFWIICGIKAGQVSDQFFTEKISTLIFFCHIQQNRQKFTFLKVEEKMGNFNFTEKIESRNKNAFDINFEPST